MSKIVRVLIVTVLLPLSVYSQVFSSSNFTMISHLDPETIPNWSGDKYSACWGWYQLAKNKEYAIACSNNGTYWVDISNPATPSVSAYKPGKLGGCTWREVKTFQHYCYVVSDDQGSNAFQIFDMQYLPDSIHTVSSNDSIFSRGHTLWVDGNKLYVAGVTYSNNTSASMNVYSLANPEKPQLLRSLNQDYNFISYVHDMFARNDTIFASCGYQGLYVFKLGNNNTFTQLGSLTSYTAGGYNHSSALTPNGKYLVFTDEVPAGLPVKVANVSNLGNIQLLSTINQYTYTTPHNPFIVNNQYCFVSSYTDGLQLYDISNPSAPFLAGYFDTYPQGGGNNNNYTMGNYEGQWGAYPFFPSKTIFALDQLNGLFFLKTALYSNPPVTTAMQKKSFKKGDLTIYPNPTSSFINVNVPEHIYNDIIEVSVKDITGRLVSTQIIKPPYCENDCGFSINVSECINGCYYLYLHNKQGSVFNTLFIISN